MNQGETLDEALYHIEKLKEENKILREALEKIESQRGLCIFGSSDTSDIPEVAFRQGSHYTYGECAELAREALGKVK